MAKLPGGEMTGIPKSTQKVSGLSRNGPQISINCLGLFVSHLIAVLPWNECLTFTKPIIILCLIDC